MPPSPPVQELPDLAAYRARLLAEGAPDKIPVMPSPDGGLLARLPAPPRGAPRGWPWDVETRPAPTAETSGWPAIFIVLPSYRQGEFIEAAIRSILLQNYPRLSLVVMDAASEDATAEILSRYQPWIGHIRSSADRGQAHAINLGFSLAPAIGLRGWLNSDDLYLPGAFHEIARAQVRRRPDFIYGDALSFDQATHGLTLDHAGLAHPCFRRYPGAIFSHAVFWDASIQLPVWEKLHCALDYELWVRLLPLTRRRLHLARPLGVIRVHASAKSHDPAVAGRWTDDARLNGLAHPLLYGPDFLLSRVHRLAGRLTHGRRRRRSQAAALAVCALSGWPAPRLT